MESLQRDWWRVRWIKFIPSKTWDMTIMVISIKSSDVLMCAKAHELIAEKTNYPLHVGITEAGTLYSGNIKSAIGLGIILNQGIGDTIRVSLTGAPLEEIKSAKRILENSGASQRWHRSCVMSNLWTHTDRSDRSCK